MALELLLAALDKMFSFHIESTFPSICGAGAIALLLFMFNISACTVATDVVSSYCSDSQNSSWLALMVENVL
jgi:hypothetical protein